MLTDNVIALSFLMTDARTSQTGLQQSCVNGPIHFKLKYLRNANE